MGMKKTGTLVMAAALALAASYAHASPQKASTSLKHLSMTYEDADWESRDMPDANPMHAVRLRNGGIVVGIQEFSAPQHGESADALLDKVEDAFKQRFQVKRVAPPAALVVPKEWSCRSFEMTLLADKETKTGITCVLVGSDYFEKMDIIVPGTFGDDVWKQVNAMLSGVKTI
jgi:hypothetical protein